MEYIVHYEYRKGGPGSALANLHELTRCGAEAIVCRIRCSSDNIMFVHQETTMSQLCSCDEYVSELRFCEIDALMRLCGYQVLTLQAVLNEYAGDKPLILHFRSIRPDAGTVQRIMRDERFIFATDSSEQLSVILQAFPEHRAIGFACHLPTAEEMARCGAFAVCMYGREVLRFRSMDFSQVREHSSLWCERLRVSEYNHITAVKHAELIGFARLIMPPDYFTQ